MKLHIRNRENLEHDRKRTSNSSKKAATFIALSLIASHVVFNSALAVSDTDFARLEQRVRTLEAKVLNAQELASNANCEKLSEKMKAIRKLYDDAVNANKNALERENRICVPGQGFEQNSNRFEKCLAEMNQRYAEDRKFRNLKIEDLRKSLESVMKEGQAACPK